MAPPPPPPPPLYGCSSCAVHDAIVFCLCCDARLCLYCDAAVHAAAAAAAHPRARLCDACGAAPAVLRCDGAVTLCGVCVGRGAPGVTRAGVATYTGCPGPAEMARLISVDPPRPQQDFGAWLADRLPLLVEEYHYQQDQQDLHLQLPPDWDVVMETARLEKMLADCYSTDEPPQPSSCQQQQEEEAQQAPAVQPSWQKNNDAGFPSCNDVLPEGKDFRQASKTKTTTDAAEHDKQTEQAASAVLAKKREARERAKLRYKEKKKNRRFCKHILYACRKAKADTRERVNGRFVKASASTSQNAAQTDEHPTIATAKRETSSSCR